MTEVRPRSSCLAVLLAVVPLLVGCGDLLVSDPVSMDTDETMPSLHFQAGLLTLPEAVEKWGRGMALDEPVAEWERSWAEAGGGGEGTRREVRRAVASLLAGSVPVSELAEAVSDLDRTLKGVNHLLGGDFPVHFSPALEAAHAERDGAREALDAGDVEASLEHVLAGGDALQSVTPKVLATELISEAETALRRIGDHDSYSQETERARRLLIGARDALERDGGVVALKRAWYAVRLLDLPVADTAGTADDPSGAR